MTPRLPTLPLRVWILWPLLGAFLLAVVGVTLFAQGAAQAAARDLGRAYAAEIGQRIDEPLSAELQGLRRRVAVNAEALAAGRIGVEDPLALSPWLYEQLRQAQHLTILSVALADGRYVAAVRRPENDEAVHLATNLLGPRSHLSAHVAGADGRPAGPLAGELARPYDPRQRAFFQRALDAEAPVWGRVESYVGWAAFGIGISAPVRDVDGTLLAVTGGTIALERLAGVLAALDLPDGGLALVVDAEGRLIASSVDAPLATGEPGQVERVALADHPHPVAAPLAARLAAGRAAAPEVLEVDGAAYLYDVRPLRDPAALGLSIVVAFPEATFTGPLGLGRDRLLVLVALVLAAVGGLGILLARAVVGPVERVTAAASRGELAELARRDACDSPVREVAGLSTALGGLADALRRSIAELEDRVQDRTRALEDANAQLVALSLRDPLTGVGNRRSFDEALVREWAGALRRRQPLALLLIDADHFKRLNDEHGHLVGDQVLQGLARAIAGVARRTTDQVARYGGEEFVVLLPDTPATEAMALAERVREAVSGAELAPGIAGVTASIGLAVAIPTPSDAPSSLVAAADAALYRAKAGGRDRVESAPGATS